MTHTNRVEQALAAIVERNRVRAARAAQDVMLTLKMAHMKAEQRRYLPEPAVPSAFGRFA